MNSKIKNTLLAVAITISASFASCRAQNALNEATQIVAVHAQTDTVAVMSQKMKRAIKNVVVLPMQYFSSKSEKYPVVYLLHGYGGCYADWSKKANLEALATQYGTIIVCPDGQDSWYFDSPIDSTMQFETYLHKELVAYIDSHYQTFAEPKMRAITGLSMGGHGALRTAMLHPDVFGSCGSMSGGVDITKFPDNWKIKLRLGNYTDNKERWQRNSVIALVPTLKNQQLNITIDDGDKDFFYEVNCNLHNALLEAGIEHDFTIRPGKHTWTYWVNSLDYHMLFFHKAFTRQ